MKKLEQHLDPSETENTKEFKAEEITDDQELREYFELYSTIWGYPLERVPDKIKAYHEGGQRIYAIKNSLGKIVAGGRMRIVLNGNTKEAYFNNKVVDKNFEGKGLGPIITQSRLKRAKQEGCELVYALVLKNNGPAIRSIFKDGFILEKSHPEKFYETKDTSHYFYFSKTLSPTQDLGTKEELKIPLSSTELIDSALNEGWIGIGLILPSDTNTDFEVPTIILKK